MVDPRRADPAVGDAPLRRQAADDPDEPDGPAGTVGASQEGPHAAAVLSTEEINRLLAAADQRWRVLLQTAIFTGLRSGELWACAGVTSIWTRA